MLCFMGTQAIYYTVFIHSTKWQANLKQKLKVCAECRKGVDFTFHVIGNVNALCALCKVILNA